MISRAEEISIQEKTPDISGRILLIGSTGLVGNFLHTVIQEGHKDHYFSPSQSELDLNQREAVLGYFKKNKPDFVINSAAFTDARQAENERGNQTGIVWKTNVTAVKNLVEACQETGTFLIHLSTEAVFPGTEMNPGPYSEDLVVPEANEKLSWYGTTKLEAEKIIQKSRIPAAIIRISFPFGKPHPKDIITRTIDFIQRDIPAYNNQYFTPTYLPDLGRSLKTIIHSKSPGIFHVACQGGTLTKYQLAAYINDRIKLRNEVAQESMIHSLQSGPPSSRLSGLNIENTQKELSISFTHWQKAIDLCIDKYMLEMIEQV